MEVASPATFRGAPLGHKEAMGLAETEFARVLDQLRGLSEDDWRQPTVCDLWDVRAMGSHVLGMAEAQASIGQFAHDYRIASKRSSGKMIAAMTATPPDAHAASCLVAGMPARSGTTLATMEPRWPCLT